MQTTEHRQDAGYPEKLADMCQSVDNYTRILVESMLYDLRMSMNARILAASKYVRLDACDDKAYDSYLRLIRNYKRALALYDERADVLVSPKLKSIMQGIEAVIRARLGLNPGEVTDELAENPIFLLKKRIINEEINKFGKVFETAAARFAAEHMDACLQYARELFVTLSETDHADDGLKLVSEIAQRQDETMREELNAACRMAIENFEELLNNNDLREEALRYRELLDAEYEILISVVKIEIPFDRACSPTEQSVAEEILAPVTEAYEALGRSMSEIHSQFEFKATEHESDSVLWDDDMQIAVLAATNYDGFANSLKAELAGVCNALEKDIGIVAEREISGKLYARAAYEYRKRAAMHELMAGEMLKVFERLAELESIELPPGDLSAIACGINETLQIKVESLSENKQTFVDELAEHIKGLRKQQPKIELRDLGELRPEIDLSVRAAFFEKYRQRMNQHISDHQEFSSKKCRAFLKESLLFEVITFGEIMNYSVSRMRGDENASDFVRMLDEAWDDLRDILNKNQITAIAPEPHEPFNGREHEVLMAEKNPDFAKGEIIKLMNLGYKQGDVVLIRANVVAAR